MHGNNLAFRALILHRKRLGIKCSDENVSKQAGTIPG